MLTHKSLWVFVVYGVYSKTVQMLKPEMMYTSLGTPVDPRVNAII